MPPPSAQQTPQQDEPSLLAAFAAAVSSLDPDIIVGWDVQRGSLGYLAERAAALALEPQLLRAAGRTPSLGSIKEKQVRRAVALNPQST